MASEKLKRSYRSEMTPNGEWSVYRLITSTTGRWPFRSSQTTRHLLGNCIDDQGIAGLINRDIIQLEPERVMKSQNYDSAGASTDYHGW